MTPEQGDKHSLIATVYYPAGDVYNIQHTTYVEPLVTEIMRTSVGGRFGAIPFHARHACLQGRTRVSGGWPVSRRALWPGTLDNALFYSTFLENLASHGYVAVLRLRGTIDVNSVVVSGHSAGSLAWDRRTLPNPT